MYRSAKNKSVDAKRSDDGLLNNYSEVPGESEVCSVINGTGSSRILLLCDHASCRIPEGYDNLGLPESEIKRHIGWDIGAAELTRIISKLLDAPAILANYSRLFVDCNRAPGDPSSIPVHCDGTFVPGNADLDDVAVEARINGYYRPHHRAISEFLFKRRRLFSVPVLVSIHSFTPVLRNGLPRPWQISVMWNHDERLAGEVLAHLQQDYPQLNVGVNEPYSGRETGYTMDIHAGSAGLPHVDFEMRQDMLQTEKDCQYWGQIIADVLSKSLSAPSLQVLKHY